MGKLLDQLSLHVSLNGSVLGHSCCQWSQCPPRVNAGICQQYQVSLLSSLSSSLSYAYLLPTARNRAVAVARVPPTALSVNGVPQGRMYLAGVLESSASPPPSEVLSRDGQRLSEDDPTTTVFSENLEGNKVYKIVVVTKTKQLFRFFTPPFPFIFSHPCVLLSVQVYTALESSRADSSSKDWRRVNYGPVSAGGRGDLRMRRVRGAVARKETKIVCNERIVIIEK
jgi:hypothetical protein